ncbi:hypothetical protein [Methylocapsa palsarum]|uniref:hypothetical protein n=1 Tax=Methylocapsa palsarum TaxID=1612308 RepID=UPI0011142488|nr:hypothetical protein [Methylocapsa palsarum]
MTTPGTACEKSDFQNDWPRPDGMKSYDVLMPSVIRLAFVLISNERRLSAKIRGAKKAQSSTTPARDGLAAFQDDPQTNFSALVAHHLGDF